MKITPTKYAFRFKSAFAKIILLCLALFLTHAQHSTSQAMAFVDPVLGSLDRDSVSVIVTADSTETAAAAVDAIGGDITSQLALINAVGARLDAEQIITLAQTPGIVSIINNHTVSVSSGPDCPDGPTETGPCSHRPGWVTDHREKKGNVRLPVSLKYAAGLAQMPDGGFVAIAEKEYVAFLNADGSIRLVVGDLDFEKMSSSPVVSQDGTVYFMGEKSGSDDKYIVYAINGNGEIIWDYEQKNLVQGLAISLDNQYLYALSNEAKAKLYILEAASGDLLEKAEPRTDKPGNFTQPPLVAADGTIYLQSSGKEPDKDDRFSNVLALNPQDILNDDEAYLWRFEASLPNGDNDKRYELTHAPLVANGFVYLFSKNDKAVFALDVQTGHLLHSYTMPKSLEGNPAVGADGTLYLPADQHFYALNPNLTLRFDFVGSDRFTTPVFSPDGEVAYTAMKKTLYAIGTESGTELWQVALKGDIKSRPTIIEDGNIVFGSDGKDMVIVTQDGRITTKLRIDDNFGQVVSSSLPDDKMLILVGEKDLLTIGHLSDRWDPEQVDVQPSEIKDEWEIVNTIALDIGADTVHQTTVMLPDEDGDLQPTPITGAGVTVAVIDSGVYVDSHVKDLLSSELYATDIKDQYIGQYDFVGDGQGPHCKISEDYNAEEGYCYYDWDKSHDEYGHGSHVAGIIWSQITDASTSVSMGIAPGANVVSVRVLGADGNGTYEDVIQGIQWVVDNQDNPELESPIRVMNLSLSAHASVPYFVDPINRAVEAAWASGIVVLAAAGNEGPGAQTITVPGNDPYIITVGAINNQRTPGYWADDEIPLWSASGPTKDGFIKPDVLAPGAQIVSFMHNDGEEIAQLLQDHPDYAETMSLFRMNGTSMATAVTSGVVALMLQVDPDLTPDQVKFRLMASAKSSITNEGELAYSLLQQGMGRVWTPDAVLWNPEIPTLDANQGMDIEADLANPWVPGDGIDIITNPSLAHHYMGPVKHTYSDDGLTHLFFMENPENGSKVALGAMDMENQTWLDYDSMAQRNATSELGLFDWNNDFIWAGGYMWVGAGGYMWVGAGDYGWIAPGGYMWVGADGYMHVNPGGYMWVGAGGYMWVGAGGYMWVGAGGYMWVGAGGYMWVGAGGYMWVGADNLEGWEAYTADPSAQSIGANKWVDDDRPEGFTVHVADLDGESAWISNSSWEQVVTITVRDEYQSRIENAIVTGSWNRGGNENIVCITGTNGECALSSGYLGEDISSVTFTIVDVQHETLEYVSQDNLDLENDSNGQSIVQQRPIYRPSIHIADIDGTSEWISSSAWAADVTLLVLDDQGNGIENATIEAKWTNGLSGSINCVTDSAGQCLIHVPTISDDVDKIQLEIEFIDHTLLYYDADENDDPDGDSNGDSIQIEPPVYRPSIHIADIDGVSEWISSSAWSAYITLLALDNHGNGVENAVIEATWINGLSGSINCVTDSAGQCLIHVPTISDDVDKIQLEIEFIDHTLLYYDADENDDPDGDSNGDNIQIEPPVYRPGMEIVEIDGSTQWINDSEWQVSITFTVLDDNSNPVSNAMVLGEWVNGISGIDSCTSNDDGQCTIVGIVNIEEDKVKFEIESLTHLLLIDNEGEAEIQVERPE